MAQTPIVELLDSIRVVVRQCPTQTMIRAYAQSAREWCDKTRWLVNTITGVTVNGTGRYTLGDDPHLEIFGIAAMSRRQGSGDWDPVRSLDGNWDVNAANGEPGAYQYIPHAAFVLAPTPNAVFDLRINAVVKPKRGVNSLPEELLTEWDETFQAGALYRLMRIPNEPWSNAAESSAQYSLFKNGIAQGCSAVFAGRNPGAAATNGLGAPSAQHRAPRSPI